MRTLLYFDIVMIPHIPHSVKMDFVTEIGVWNVDDSDPDKGYWRYRKWKNNYH